MWQRSSKDSEDYERRKWVGGGVMRINTPTRFKSKSYTCVEVISKGVISNHRSYDLDLGRRSYFSSMVQIFCTKVEN